MVPAINKRDFLFLRFLIYGSLLFSCCAHGQEHNRTGTPLATHSEIVSYNGIWSWFSDPRAVYFEGIHKRTYLGWIDNYGDIIVSYLDHETGEQKVQKVYEHLEIDDHNNPSLIFDEKGRLSLYFTSHLINDDPLYKISAKKPEDISSWNLPERLYLNDEDRYGNARILNHTYSNPLKNPSKPKTWYLFYRGVDMQPSIAISKDEGLHWNRSQLLFNGNDLEIYTPYLKVYQGKEKIHFFLTSDHPTRALKTNRLFYFFLRNGIFYDQNEREIATSESLPILPDSLEPMREFQQNRAWCWDIKEDEKGLPVVTYVEFQEDKHIYKYAFFDGNIWKHKSLIDSGGAFPEQVDDTILEPHYSGGLIINPANPKALFASVKRNGVFEIEKWEYDSKKDAWTHFPITENSKNHNVRPVIASNANMSKKDTDLFWLEVLNYKYYSSHTKPGFGEFSFLDRYSTMIRTSIDFTKKDHASKLEDFITHHFTDNSARQQITTDYLYLLALEKMLTEINNVALQLEITNMLDFEKNKLYSSQEIEVLEIDDFTKTLYLYNPDFFERDQVQKLKNSILKTETPSTLDRLVIQKMKEQELNVDFDLLEKESINRLTKDLGREEAKLSSSNFKDQLLHFYYVLKYKSDDKNYQSKHKAFLDSCLKFYDENFGQQYQPDVSGLLLLYATEYHSKFK